MKQVEVAKKAKITEAYLSQILSRNRQPSYGVALRLAKATKSDVHTWMVGTEIKLRKIVERA